MLQNDDPILTKFKHDHDLREDSVLDLQSISNHNTVKISGKEYSLDNLETLNVFTDNATYSLDGELQLSPPVSEGIFVTTNSDDGSTILVATNDKNEVESVDLFRSDGSDDHLVSVVPNILATIKPDDLDPSIIEGLKIDMMDEEDVADRSAAESEVVENVDLTTGEEKEEYANNNVKEEGVHKRLLLKEEEAPSIMDTLQNPKGTRVLQTPSVCSSYKTIDIAIVADSTFCERYGFNFFGHVYDFLAIHKVQMIVARASMMYQNQGGVCTQLKISHLDLNCNRSTDPYRSLVVNGDMSCSNPTSKDILKNFRNKHSRDRPDIKRDADAVHLFFGTRRQGAIGCAYTNTLCGGYAYGVNDMSYTNNGLVHSVLFAHELGHNAGLRHVSGSPHGGKYIMGSSLSVDSFYRWSPTSVKVLEDNLHNKFSCLSTTKSISSPYSRQFVLINPATGKALDVKGASCSNGANIQLWDRNDGAAQVFHYHYASKAIVNVKCDKAIDIYKARCGLGANIILWDKHGRSSQQFQFYSDQTIRSVSCDYTALDIYAKFTARGTNIRLWLVDYDWDKKWKVVYV